MTANERIPHILKHILDYCGQIEKSVEVIGTRDALKADFFNQNALSMPLAQIGELVGVIPDGFKETHGDIPWKQIRGMRNLLVHHYGKTDWDDIWDTAQEDVPLLQSYCKKILDELRSGSDGEP